VATKIPQSRLAKFKRSKSHAGTRTHPVETGRQTAATGKPYRQTKLPPVPHGPASHWRRSGNIPPPTELPTRRLGLNLDINPSRQRQLVQSVDRLAGRLNDINQPFMGADFELLPRLLIDVRAAQHRVTLNPGRERNGTMDDRARPLGRIDDLRRRLVEYGMIVGFHADADPFLFFPSHSQFPSHTTS